MSSSATFTPSRALAEEEAARTGSGLTLPILALVVTRLWMLFSLVPISSDRIIYFNYAVRGYDLGQSAYRDFSVEYPPLGYWTMVAPRLLTDPVTPDEARDRPEMIRRFGVYSLLFRLQMLALDLLAFTLLVDLVRRLRPDRLGIAAWSYVGCTTVLAHVMYDRLDVGLAALLLAWWAMRVRVPAEGRGGLLNVVSFAVLGLGIGYKLVGIVALPFVLLSEWTSSGGTRAQRLARSVALAVVAGLAAGIPVLIHAPWAGLDSLKFLTYHGERTLEIESTYASGFIVASAFGAPLATVIDHGSANVAGETAAAVARFSPVVLAAALGLGLLVLLRNGPVDRPRADRAGALAILVTLLLSKVLSAQYLVFGLPLVLVCGTAVSRRTYGLLAAMVLTAAVLTTLVFPYLWFPYYPVSQRSNPYALVPDLHWLPCSLLVVRNLLLVAMVAILIAAPRPRRTS